MSRKHTNMPTISVAFYGFCLVLGFLLSKLFFRVKTKKDPALKKVEDGLLILANHQSYIDPVFLMMAFPRRKIHFVAGRYLFEKKLNKKLLTWLGVIAKEQMRPDTTAIRDLLLLAKANKTISIFPEGQRSIDGRTNPIQPVTARLIKKLKLPVASVRLSGSYLSWPRWSKRFRFGKVTQEAKLLFTAEEVKRLDLTELNARLIKALYADDYALQLEESRPRHYVGKNPAERMDSVLHWCPACASPFSLTATGKEIGCRSCNLTVGVEKSGLLTVVNGPELSPSPAVWHENQITMWCEYVNEHGFSFNASLYEKQNRTGLPGRKARLTVTPVAYEIDVEDGSRITVASHDSKALFADYGDFFRLFSESRPLYIWPDNGQAVIACLDLLLGGYM